MFEESFNLLFIIHTSHILICKNRNFENPIFTIRRFVRGARQVKVLPQGAGGVVGDAQRLLAAA